MCGNAHRPQHVSFGLIACLAGQFYGSSVCGCTGASGAAYGDPTFVEYDLDSEDERWLEAFNQGQVGTGQGRSCWGGAALAEGGWRPVAKSRWAQGRGTPAGPRLHLQRDDSS